MSIRPQIRTITSHTLIYGIGNVISKAVALILIPIYTRYLSKEDVGIIALLEMIEFFMITLLPLGISTAMWRFLSNNESLRKEQVIATAYWGILGTTLTGAMLLFFFSGSISTVLDINDFGMLYIKLVTCNIFLFIGGQFILWLKRFEQKPGHFLIITLLQFVLTILLTIYFVVFLHKGIYGVLISKLIVLGLLFIISGYYTLKAALICPQAALFARMLKYGAPLISLALVTPVLTFSDRYFLNMFVSLEQIGVYSIAYKLGMLINIILVAPLQRGWSPLMFHFGIEKDIQAVYRDILFYYALIGGTILLGIAFFARDILAIVATEEYLAGVNIIPVIGMAYYINGFRNFFMAGAALKDRTGLLGTASLAAIVLNLVFNYFFIKYWGLAGAAWATAISYIILVVLIYLSSQRVIYIDWGWNRIIKLSVILLLLLPITLYFQGLLPGSRLPFALGGLGVFVVSVILTKTVGSKEINGLRSIIHSIRNRFK